MTENNGDAAPPLSAPAAPRGHVLIAWLAIALMASGIVYWQNEGKKGAAADTQREAVNLIMLEFQARLFVAIPEFAKAGGDTDPDVEKKARASLVRQVEMLNRGSVDERLCALIALGELAGPTRALEGIEKLDKDAEEAQYEMTPNERKRVEILRRIYTDYADGRPTAPTVSPDERKFIEDSLGWFGDLALSPAEPDAPPSPKRVAALADADRTLKGGTTILIIAAVAFLVGLFGLLLIAYLAVTGRWRSRLGPAVAHHGVYVETFALWFAVYFALMGVMPWVTASRLPQPIQLSLPMILSLAVLAWPVWRGVAWKQVRQDVGLTLGEQPLLEPSLGFVSYMNSLPFVVVGLGIVVMLQFFVPKPSIASTPFQPSPNMAHPLIQTLRDASLGEILPFFFLMSVFAPTMEEIMFRGVLYRHLRDATRRWPMGVIISVLVMNIVFAAVHPQGLLAIPLLASLACGFTLAREWRGTLIPAIIAHGLNNSLIFAFVLLCLRK
jgi:membrane protease YdiL (CAAX protease family)